MLQAGALRAWWECRSANAAVVALRKSGVKFRQIVHDDGRVERWKEPWLASWEIPRRDPREPRPAHPVVRAQRQAASQRWRERKLEREAELATERSSPPCTQHQQPTPEVTL